MTRLARQSLGRQSLGRAAKAVPACGAPMIASVRPQDRPAAAEPDAGNGSANAACMMQN
jgi:hypothetical protein